MDETKTPTTKSFVERLDDAVQQVKRNPKFMLEYLKLQMSEDEFSRRLADGSLLRIIVKGTGATEAEVSKILADDAPTDSEV